MTFEITRTGPRAAGCALMLLFLSGWVPTASAQSGAPSWCFTQPPRGSLGEPWPVIMGMTHARVLGEGRTFIESESFFDGTAVDDDFSAAQNLTAGVVDCDQSPDLYIAWGYSFADRTPAETGDFFLSVTFYDRTSAYASGCDFYDNPTLVVYDIWTGPSEANLVEVASSMMVKVDALSCGDGSGYFQFRTRSVAAIDFQPTAFDLDGCFVVAPTTGTCPGSGDVCI